MIMNCGVCLEPFDETLRRPKSLPCGHTYCLACLQSLQRKECPFDRKVFEDAATLPDNFLVLQIADRPAKPARRFWCLHCKREAVDLCEEEHNVCSLKKSRAQRAKPCLDALLAGGAALQGMRELLDDAVGDLQQELIDHQDELYSAQVAMDDSTDAMQAAMVADDEVLFEKARARLADAVDRHCGLPRSAARLLAALADPASECSVALEGPGGAWRGSVRPREAAAARLLLCSLLLAESLELQPGTEDDGQEDVTGVSQEPLTEEGAGDGQRDRQEDDGQRERHGDVRQDQEQDAGLEQASAVQLMIPSKSPRWQECSNAISGSLLLQEMAARMVYGSRVVRGRDWTKVDFGRPDGPGTVVAVRLNRSPRFTVVDVMWDLGGCIKDLSVGGENVYEVRLLTCMDEVTLPDDIQRGSTACLDLRDVSLNSSFSSKSRMLVDQDFSQVRALLGLRCYVSPNWSGLLLVKAATHANLEVLELRGASTRHMRVVTDMPRLHSLHLDSVTPATLPLALSVPSLRRLEVHCSPDAPLMRAPGPLPVAPALEWLRVGVYPLLAALAIIRAHAATLRELELVAASDQPYGCPDLADMLADCGLRKLQKLVLRRDSPQHFCRHDKKLCRIQKSQLWDMMQFDWEQDTQIMCSVCDRV